MLTLISHARRHELHGTVFETMVSPSVGSTELASWIVTLPPGAAGVEHWVTREEIFLALEGSARVRGGGQELELAAGAALLVPAGTAFSLSNAAQEPFRAVAALPVGARAVLPDGTRLNPPWAQ